MRSRNTGVNMSLDGGSVVAPIIVYGLVSVGALTGGVVAAYLTWTHAPAVGGEWWPYIRVIASAVAFMVSAKVSAIVSIFATAALAFVAAVVLGVVGR